MTEKCCSACGDVKALTEFYRQSSAKDGRQRYCRDCTKARKRAWVQENPEHVQRYNRTWQDANPDLAKALTDAWRRRNPEQYAQSKREWEQAHHTSRLAAARADRAQNLERHRTRLAAWKAANRDRVREHQRRRRAAARGAHTDRLDIDALRAAANGMCALCSEPVDPDLSWPDPLSESVDHILPLSMGGPHEQSNVQIAHLLCNLRKGAKPPEPLPV